MFLAVAGGCASTPSRAPAAAPADCSEAPPAVLSAISTGLKGGTKLSRSAMIRDPDRSSVYLVAAEIDGPGVDGPGQVGVWATNRTDGSGSLFAVDNFAGQFSDWGKMPDASSSEWTLARSCL